MPDLISAFIPLGCLIVLGFVLGRFATLDLKSVAALAIFGFTPIVGFGAAAQLEFTPQLLLLPAMTFICASFVGVAAFVAGRLFLKDETQAYLLPIACGSGNTGYFGLPVALALFGEKIAGLYLLMNLGVTVFETTLGYFFMARGAMTGGEAVKRVLKLPLLYALLLGLVVAASGLILPAPLIKLWELSKGAYVCIGMMIIGIALSPKKSIAFRPRLFTLGLTGKFLLWPALAIGLSLLDAQYLQLFGSDVHNCLVLLSIAPMAANLAAYAAHNDLRVDLAATLILLTTGIAVIGLPFLVPLFVTWGWLTV
ncbi:MAG: AEC family transporter [Pseudobdellovibrionaceae bacterium]